MTDTDTNVSARSHADCIACTLETAPPSRRVRRGGMHRRVVTTMVASAAVIAMAGAAAHAAPFAAPVPTPAAQDGISTTPDPGGQGGINTTPDPSGGGQSGIGTTPDPTPAPAPAPGPSVIPAPTYDTAPVYENSPSYQAPTYSGAYNPIPRTITAPKRVAPVAPVLPNRLKHPGVIKLGNIRVPQGVIADADARNLNGQAATIEARVATYYESIGFPPDQAARTAASTTVGILVGGTAGAIAVGIPAAVLGGVVGAGVGTAAGAIIGGIVGTPTGPGAAGTAGAGALIGLGVGTGVGIAGGAAGGAALGALGGGALGGIIGYAVGAGDPGGNPNAPLAPTTENPLLSKPAPPHPDNNQYEVHLDNKALPGGAKVDYVVSKSGAVDATAKVGAASVPLHISAAQADAPFKAAGAFAQTARDTVNNAVADLGRQAERAIPGLKIAHPQFDAPTRSTAKHRR